MGRKIFMLSVHRIQIYNDKQITTQDDGTYFFPSNFEKEKRILKGKRV